MKGRNKTSWSPRSHGTAFDNLKMSSRIKTFYLCNKSFWCKQTKFAENKISIDNACIKKNNKLRETKVTKKLIFRDKIKKVVQQKGLNYDHANSTIPENCRAGGKKSPLISVNFPTRGTKEQKAGGAREKKEKIWLRIVDTAIFKIQRLCERERKRKREGELVAILSGNWNFPHLLLSFPRARGPSTPSHGFYFSIASSPSASLFARLGVAMAPAVF